MQAGARHGTLYPTQATEVKHPILRAISPVNDELVSVLNTDSWNAIMALHVHARFCALRRIGLAYNSETASGT